MKPKPFPLMPFPLWGFPWQGMWSAPAPGMPSPLQTPLPASFFLYISHPNGKATTLYRRLLPLGMVNSGFDPSLHMKAEKKW